VPARPFLRILLLALAAVVLFAALDVRRVEAGKTTKIVARQLSAPLHGSRRFQLPGDIHHMAVHWRGTRDARVTVAVSRDGRSFGRPQRVVLDEVGEQRRNGETYGSVMPAVGVKALRVSSDRPLGRLTVLAIGDGQISVRRRWQLGGDSSASVQQPAVMSRAGWGADESLRFNADGSQKWPPEFHPVQKLIVHHTATRNGDPDPTSTIRSIYYYHAVTQGWGDIGYNFLVDESGRIYEGRYSRPYAAGEYPTGEDTSGQGVTGAHAQGFNSGTVGVALLGTLTDQDGTSAASGALERFLAWEADHHGIDPQGSLLYTNPVNGTQKTFPNIAGHRDVNATECPGNVFYSTLPTIRQHVAALISGTPSDVTPPAAPSGLTVLPGKGSVALDWNNNSESDLAGYRVYRRNADGTWPSSPRATVTASAFTDTGLKPSKTYTYRVTAFDRSGNQSAPSATASATPRRR
jgi:N-acetylmuramoyl-L-alanine amidase/Fibronectin type III domain